MVHLRISFVHIIRLLENVQYFTMFDALTLRKCVYFVYYLFLGESFTTIMHLIVYVKIKSEN